MNAFEKAGLKIEMVASENGIKFNRQAEMKEHTIKLMRKDLDALKSYL